MKSLFAAAAALAASVTAAQDCAPEQFWVNYGDSTDAFVISWLTSSTDDSIVNYGTSPSLGQKTTGPAPTTYTYQSYTSGFIHHVVIDNIPLDTTIYYTVGGAACGYSETMNFVSHPGVGPSAKSPLSFAVVGDLGQTGNSNDTVNHILADVNAGKLTAVIHAGDLSYADEDEPRWDSWQQLTAPLSSRRPWMTVVGNHEIEAASGIEDFRAYNARWRMPYVAGAPSLYYSFETGLVHWIMLSSYSDFDSSSDQFAWLGKDIAGINKANTPWTFVVLHAPWYNSNYAHHLEGEAMRQAMEETLYAAGVDLVLAGHVHAYERNHRTFNNARDAKGPTYITIGDGGNREGLATQWYSPQPVWSDFRKASYGHGQIDVINATHTYWSWHANPDTEPTIEDELWLVKGQDN